MRFSPTDKVKISDQVLSQEVSGETVLLDLQSEFYFGLDKTGTRIWELLQAGLSIQDLIGKMLDEFEVDRQTLEADVNALLEKLLDAGLVSVESS
jgi:hypothetical protein